MTYLLLGLGLLVLVLVLGTQIQKANPRTLARWLVRLGVIAALGLGGFLIFTGRFAHVLPALVGGAMLYARLRRMGGLGGARGPARQGQTSEVQTAYLRARLDHDTGAVTGTVLRGAFAGRELTELGEGDLAALYVECLREDEEAARLVEAFLDRGPHAATWRDRMAGGQARSDGPMTAAEARRILGVGTDAGVEEIRDAHRRLMMANHPDRGGSAYLAAKINQARDVLLAA